MKHLLIKAGLTKKKLRDQYQEHTDAEIGKIWGVSGEAIQYWRHRWNIPTINARQRRDLKREGLPKLDDLTPAKLQALYSQMGERQIAALYGVSKIAIRYRRKKWGIQPKSKAERATRSQLFTLEQQEVVIGTLLGDAHLSAKGVLSVSHAQHQLDYLRRIHTVLAPHCREIRYGEKRMEKSGALTFGFSFRTIQHTWLQALRKVFYPEGIRVFPESVLKELSPLSLAYWYFDDGHMDLGLPSFALGNIKEEEAQEVITAVRERFGLDVYSRPVTPTCQVMRIRARSADIFFSLVREHATPDMLHKLPPKHWPRGLVPKRNAHSNGGIPLPPDLDVKARQWENLSSEVQKELLDDMVAFWHGRGFPHPEPRPEELVALKALEERHVIQDGKIKGRQVGQTTCNAFATHIWEAKSYKSKWSPREIFDRPDLLRKALVFPMRMGNVPNGSQVRGAVRSWRMSGVYNFRPSAAKVLVDRYCRVGGVVWDPCGGYGGRLLGTLLSKAVPKYIACEPQPETCVRLQHLVDWVDTYIPGTRDRVELYRVPAEDFSLSEKVDLVLTSPPYWRRETYGVDTTQSGVRYPTYESWLQGFLKPVIQKAVEALRPGGWLVLNVDDFKLDGVGYPLVMDTRQICAGLGLGEPEVFQYMMPAFNDRENSESVLCWSRGTAVNVVSDTAPPLNLTRCQKCGRPFPFQDIVRGLCVSCLEPEGLPIKCEECQKTFFPTRKGTRFCSQACGAVSRRRRKRASNPVSKFRTFTCKECERQWKTDLPGRFTRCPSCVEKREIANRTKTCGYRNCGKTFVDTSVKNSMKFCCPAHRDKEKRLRVLSKAR